MDERNEEAQSTYAVGQRALNEINARDLPVTPRNFEFWYTYLSGVSAGLSGTVDALMAEGANVDQVRIDSLYASYILRSDLREKIDAVGSRVGEEIEAMMTAIDLAVRQTAVYGTTLHDESVRFASGLSSLGALDVIQTLLRSTIEMETKNKALELRLRASRSEISRLKNDLETVRADSLSDPLTGLGNRKHFDLAIRDALATAASSCIPLCVLVGDVDHFKKINDKFGHSIGDEALRHVAHSLRDSVRNEDIVCRYGGEEFAVVLPNATLEIGMAVAERIRQTIAARRLVRRATGEKLDKLTISLGVAIFRSGDTATSLYDRADRCLYAAKHRGRDRAVGENDLGRPDQSSET